MFGEVVSLSTKDNKHKIIFQFWAKAFLTLILITPNEKARSPYKIHVHNTLVKISCLQLNLLSRNLLIFSAQLHCSSPNYSIKIGVYVSYLHTKFGDYMPLRTKVTEQKWIIVKPSTCLLTFVNLITRFSYWNPAYKYPSLLQLTLTIMTFHHTVMKRSY